MKRKELVGNPDLTPDWFKKYKGIMDEINRQLLRGLCESGKGLTLDQMQLVVEHKNPFAEIFFLDRLLSRTEKLLSEHFSKEIEIDPLPVGFTEDNLRKWEKYNLRPVFLPDEEIAEEREIKDWTKPRKWFYDMIREKRIVSDSAKLKRGWYLADFTTGTDYKDGKQVFVDDPLSPIIERLRDKGKVGKYEQTPLGSRFAIVPRGEWPLVFIELAKEIGLNPEKIRLERAIEFNAIGNLYNDNRGKFNVWEWFADDFEGSGLLYGGHRGDGGLAGVCHGWSVGRGDDIAGRPLVSF